MEQDSFGLLTVQCISGAGLGARSETTSSWARAAQVIGRKQPRLPDAAVQLTYGQTVKRSAVVSGSSEPVWRRETLSFELDLETVVTTELSVEALDVGKEDASLGRATLDLSSILSGRVTQLDLWLPLDQQGANARLRLAVAFDVLERPLRPGEAVELSGLWPEEQTTGAFCRADFGLGRGVPLIVLDETRGDDVLVGYATGEEGRFVLRRNALRRARKPVFAAKKKGLVGMVSRPTQSIVDSISHGATVLAASPAAEAVASRTVRVLESENLAASGADLAREGFQSLSLVAGRWRRGGAAMAKSDLVYALGGQATATKDDGDDFDDVPEDEDEQGEPPSDDVEHSSEEGPEDVPPPTEEEEEVITPPPPPDAVEFDAPLPVVEDQQFARETTSSSDNDNNLPLSISMQSLLTSQSSPHSSAVSSQGRRFTSRKPPKDDTQSPLAIPISLASLKNLKNYNARR